MFVVLVWCRCTTVFAPGKVHIPCMAYNAMWYDSVWVPTNISTVLSRKEKYHVHDLFKFYDSKQYVFMKCHTTYDTNGQHITHLSCFVSDTVYTEQQQHQEQKKITHYVRQVYMYCT